jgi:hypothetical protein
MPNNDTAAQVARLREMAARFKHDADINRDDASSVRNGHVLRLYVEELDGYASDLSAAADALEREAWCEEMGADVEYNSMDELWWVNWMSVAGGCKDASALTRNAAIDAARRGGR